MVSVCFYVCFYVFMMSTRGTWLWLQGRIDVLSRHLDMAPAGLKGSGAQMASRRGKSRAAIVAAATAAGMAAGGVLVADGPKDAELMLTVEPGRQVAEVYSMFSMYSFFNHQNLFTCDECRIVWHCGGV